MESIQSFILGLVVTAFEISDLGKRFPGINIVCIGVKFHIRVKGVNQGKFLVTVAFDKYIAFSRLGVVTQGGSGSIVSINGILVLNIVQQGIYRDPDMIRERFVEFP